MIQKLMMVEGAEAAGKTEEIDRTGSSCLVCRRRMIWKVSKVRGQ